jgi:SpoVK/Ycf46/Vps4 family AAA+-type ATPase
MKINIIDEHSAQLGNIPVNLDKVFESAELSGVEVFESAVTIIKKIVKDNYPENGVINSYDSVIQKWLKEFASLGKVKKDLTLKVVSTKGVSSTMDFDSNVFEEVIILPQTTIQQRYQRLVGLDELKNKIRKEASVWLAPETLETWSVKFHHKKIVALKIFRDRYPFFIFEGDVGTGKTDFAETFGDDIARAIKKDVLLARVSMKSRGNGVVGEMSKLISKIFSEAENLANIHRSPVVLLLDEADSLAQSREESQMHHEDRAGVNSLIQGIDKIRASTFPVMLVFCTNRVQALDPAIKRRAAMIHTFVRPNEEQRMEVFRKHLEDLDLKQHELKLLVDLTGESTKRKHGYTYSDLVTRLIPEAILAAYPDKSVSFNVFEEVVRRIVPTPPFSGVDV